MSQFDVDSILETCLKEGVIPEQQLVSLLAKLMEVLYTEDNGFELSSPITIFGDIHGQLYNIFELF